MVTTGSQSIIHRVEKEEAVEEEASETFASVAL